MRQIFYKIVLVFFTLLTSTIVSSKSLPNAGIASAHPLATEAGFEILAQGGNAFDAAVAVSATLAVVEPYSSGLGGGGFWLLHEAKNKREVVIDGRERAPYSASETLYQDSNGNVIPKLSVDGALAAGIPGEPAALVHIAKKYGNLPLSKSLAPAIRAANKGFAVTQQYQRMAGFRLSALQQSAAAAKIFLLHNKVPPLGHKIIQKDLAATLERISQFGFDGFYAGEVAKKLVKTTRAANGIWTLKDLSEYQIVEREPLIGYYQGYKITSVPPPSSGGVALLSMFAMLSNYDLKKLSSLQQKHLTVEVMRRAYRDRAEFLGDSDMVNVPVLKLISNNHAKKLIQNINLAKSSPSNRLAKNLKLTEGNDTTHFSIIDKQGNRVSATLSVNYPFGSCFVADGTGILLNDEMDDFSAKPGVPNVYGLVGAKANAIAPGKRMLSSMSPSFIENDEQLAIIGTPGGSRIITMVFHGMMAFMNGAAAQEIVDLPRYHHQYLPDVIQVEDKAISKSEYAALQKLGHTLKKLDSNYGNMQLVTQNKKTKKVSVASDFRGEGFAKLN
ncbi:Gamma-glutamyltranspeptidase @ Glutathione hydrolase [hydrothermal vent metagenome]|uniref:Gamma-glutamyltranspeptidase @ Glutathione hydrolase n=1 Tax=hydrothermal vent metagenome TaxID=652676 RepID=A0A3B1B5J6_9ZZZZ